MLSLKVLVSTTIVSCWQLCWFVSSCCLFLPLWWEYMFILSLRAVSKKVQCFHCDTFSTIYICSFSPSVYCPHTHFTLSPSASRILSFLQTRKVQWKSNKNCAKCTETASPLLLYLMSVVSVQHQYLRPPYALQIELPADSRGQWKQRETERQVWMCGARGSACF